MEETKYEEILHLALITVLVVGLFVVVVAIAGAFTYCAIGNIDHPRYQYICGHSVDIK
jgi:hypothetical protein